MAVVEVIVTELGAATGANVVVGWRIREIGEAADGAGVGHLLIVYRTEFAAQIRRLESNLFAREFADVYAAAVRITTRKI
jgi:hypothetical protein